MPRTAGTLMSWPSIAATLALLGPSFPQGAPAERIEVRVLDERRAPMRGLTASDFTVLVHGVAQPIESVTEMVFRPGEPPPRPRVFLLLLDDINTPRTRAITERTTNVAHALIDRLRPDDQVAVMLTSRMNGWREPPTDPDAARAAVDRFATGGLDVRFPRPLPITVLVHFALTRPEMDAGGHGVLVYVGPGTPNMGPSTNPMLTSVALRSLTCLARTPTSAYAFSNLGARPRGVPPDRLRSRDEGHAMLRAIAGDAGGFAVVDTDDVAASVAGLVREQSHSYSVSYRSVAIPAPGQPRPVVQVAQAGARVLWPCQPPSSRSGRP